MPEPRERFDEYLRDVVHRVGALPDAIGLVGMGSTADRARVDEWSDHDLALITAPGAASRYPRAGDWLPAGDDIAIEVHEHHGGVKVVYDDGHVVEYGATDLEGLASWAASDYEVLIDHGGVQEVMKMIAAKAPPIGLDPVRDIRLLLILVLIGVGRARRGEGLNASGLVRGDAVSALLRAVAARVPRAPRARGDILDPTRRFERSYPTIAGRIERLLARSVEDCARGLLDLAIELFGVGEDGVPARGLAAVTRRLGWVDQETR